MVKFQQKIVDDIIESASSDESAKYYLSQHDVSEGDLSEAVKQLARNKKTVELERVGRIFSIYEKDFNEYVATGYAWGGHEELLDKLYSTYPMNNIGRVEGYARARNIKKVNEFIPDNNDYNYFNSVAKAGYAVGGHLNNYEHVLELICLTESAFFREQLVDYFVKHNPDIESVGMLETVNNIIMLMRNSKLSYAKAKETYLEVDKELSSKAEVTITLQSPSALFKKAAAAQLSYFQNKAVAQIEGLHEKDMLSWKSCETDKVFSVNHFLMLSFLMKGKQLSAKDAIAEINQLSAIQVIALYELYDKGLRGDDLRIWAAKNTYIFNHDNLEKLLNLCADNKTTPVNALNQLSKSSVKMATRVIR